jgi:hypothetical protein
MRTQAEHFSAPRSAVGPRGAARHRRSRFRPRPTSPAADGRPDAGTCAAARSICRRALPSPATLRRSAGRRSSAPSGDLYLAGVPLVVRAFRAHAHRFECSVSGRDVARHPARYETHLECPIARMCRQTERRSVDRAARKDDATEQRFLSSTAIASFEPAAPGTGSRLAEGPLLRLHSRTPGASTSSTAPATDKPQRPTARAICRPSLDPSVRSFVHTARINLSRTRARSPTGTPLDDRDGIPTVSRVPPARRIPSPPTLVRR